MDQFYFEEGYVEQGYFTVIREASANIASAFTPSFTVNIADDTGYYIPDYIAEGYYALPIQEAAASLEVTASVTVDATRIQDSTAALDSAFTATSTTGRLQTAEANFGSLFSPSIQVAVRKNAVAILDSTTDLTNTVSKFTGYESLQEFIAALNAQNDRIRAVDAEFNTLANANTAPDRLRSTGVDLSATASLDIVSDVIGNLEADLTVETDLVTIGQVGNFVISSASLTVESTVTARPISYQLRDRFTTLTVYQDPSYDSIVHDTSISKFGTGSVRRVSSGSYDVKLTGLSYSNSLVQNWNTIDFWYYIDDPVDDNYVHPFFQIGDYYLRLVDPYPSGQSTAYLKLFKNNTSINLDYYNIDEPRPANTNSYNYFNFDLQTWTHIRILKSGTNLKVYFNGVDVLEYIDYNNSFYSDLLFLGHELFGLNESTTEDYLFDDLYVSSNQLNTYSDTNIAIPTTPATDDASRILLVPFDEDLEDQKRSITFDSIVDLQSNAVITATPNATFDGITIHAGTFTTVANIDRIRNSGADLSSQFNQTTEARLKPKEFIITEDIISSLNAEIGVIKPLSAQINSTSELTTTVTAIKPLSAQINSVATISADASGTAIGLVATELNSQFAINAASTRVRFAQSQLDSNSTVSVLGGTVFDFNADLNTETSVSVDSIRIKSAEIDTDSIATQLAAVAKIGDFLVTLESNFAINTDPTVDSAGGAHLIATAAQVTEPLRLLGFDVNLDSTAEIQALTGAVFDADVNMISLFTPDITVRTLHVEQYVYSIPQEIRVISITNESRSFSIHQETRSFSIEG